MHNSLISASVYTEMCHFQTKKIFLNMLHLKFQKFLRGHTPCVPWRPAGMGLPPPVPTPHSDAATHQPQHFLQFTRHDKLYPRKKSNLPYFLNTTFNYLRNNDSFS